MLAPNAGLRAVVVPGPAQDTRVPSGEHAQGAGIPTGAVVHKGKVYVDISGSGGTPPTGWTRKDNVLVGTQAAGAVAGGAVKIESWREVR